MDQSYEQALQKHAFNANADRAFTDKLLGRQDAESLKNLIKKEDLTRSDLLELLYLVCSVEIKLVNFDARDRYILGKYYTWIRDLVKLAEFIYDYEQQVTDEEPDPKAKEKFEKINAKLTKIGIDTRDIMSEDERLISNYDNQNVHLTDPDVKMIQTNIRSIKQMNLHNIKFSVDIFLYLTRSTLSLGAMAFDTLSKSRFEYDYSKDPPFMPQQVDKRSFLSIKR